jgi:hypothetical protein
VPEGNLTDGASLLRGPQRGDAPIKRQSTAELCGPGLGGLGLATRTRCIMIPYQTSCSWHFGLERIQPALLCLSVRFPVVAKGQPQLLPAIRKMVKFSEVQVVLTSTSALLQIWSSKTAVKESAEWKIDGGCEVELDPRSGASLWWEQDFRGDSWCELGTLLYWSWGTRSQCTIEHQLPLLPADVVALPCGCLAILRCRGCGSRRVAEQYHNSFNCFSLLSSR